MGSARHYTAIHDRLDEISRKLDDLEHETESIKGELEVVGAGKTLGEKIEDVADMVELM